MRAGLPAPAPGAPFLPGPVLAAPYHLADDPHPTGGFGYARFGNPTWVAYEQAVGELEGGEAVVFASGMAALSAVVLPLAAPGAAIVLPADGYYTLRLLAQEHLVPHGVSVREVPTARPLRDEDVEGAVLAVVETPSNPGLDVCDIAAAATVCARHGVPLAVDNTTATPLGQRPLALGADYTVSADTKAMSGHSDVLLGHVACRDPRRATAVRTWRTRTGAVPGPFETWLAHRSLGTLDLRLARHAANALALAEVLRDHPAVRTVRYPGLPGDAAYEVASRQMHRHGGVLSFDLDSAERVATFLAASALVGDATSFGGLHTTADRRDRWGGDAVSPGFVRLSAGCEDTGDLVADVSAALDAVAAADGG